MLQVTLTAEDLDLVQVAPRLAPMLELRMLLLQPAMHHIGGKHGRNRAEVELARSLVAHPCAPGFLFPLLSEADEAIDQVVSTRRTAIRRDLEDNVSAGFPLPAWSAELVRPGYAGTQARNSLHAALTHVTSTYIDVRSRWAAPMVLARTKTWKEAPTTRGARAMLNSLHPGIRCRGSVLEIDLASSADVQATAVGSGIRIVPTLSAWPTATISTDGTSPLVLSCPVPIAAEQPLDPIAVGDRALEHLIGSSRSILLTVIATHPALGTRELARLTGLAPASVSDHSKVLRSAGLIGVQANGARATHCVTALGRALLLHAATTA